MNKVDAQLPLDALRWAWTNMMGRLPDRNTMTEEEIKIYWTDYRDILRRAIKQLSGSEPI
jgi:hypothetical protein